MSITECNCPFCKYESFYDLLPVIFSIIRKLQEESKSSSKKAITFAISLINLFQCRRDDLDSFYVILKFLFALNFATCRSDSKTCIYLFLLSVVVLYVQGLGTKEWREVSGMSLNLIKSDQMLSNIEFMSFFKGKLGLSESWNSQKVRRFRRSVPFFPHCTFTQGQTVSSGRARLYFVEQWQQNTRLFLLSQPIWTRERARERESKPGLTHFEGWKKIIWVLQMRQVK